MKLKAINHISNYRNLSDVSLGFSNNITYIVGENNLGKTNIFDLLEKLFKAKDFSEDDFLDNEKAIEFHCVFFQGTEENGFWGDHFDKYITINVYQEPDERSVFSIEQDPVHQIIRKRFCYISIASELGLNSSLPNFLPRSKYGKSIEFLYQRIKETTKDKELSTIINQDEINTIKTEIEHTLKDIDIFNDFKIGQHVNIAEFIATVLFLVEKHSDRHIDDSGSGLKRRIHIILYIMGQILNHCDRYSHYIEELKNNSTVDLSVIIALDEPELHLHPHWQRKFINELESLFENTSLIPGLKISCQFIIVTHSPYMIPSSFNYILNRLYLNNKKINASIIEAEEDTQNHSREVIDYVKKTHDQFIDQFREAYFAKGVLLVEGDSDYGIINAYHQIEKNILDKHSISVIKLGGAGNVAMVCEWFHNLSIPVIPILDKDQIPEVQKHSTQSWYQDIIWSDKIHLEESVYEVGHQNSNLFVKIRNELCIEPSTNKAQKQVNKCTFFNKQVFSGISNFQLHRQSEQTRIFKSNFLDLSTDEDKDLHKLLWVCSLSQIKSTYQGLLLGRLLIKHHCYPTYLKNGIDKLIEKIKEEVSL